MFLKKQKNKQKNLKQIQPVCVSVFMLNNNID